MKFARERFTDLITQTQKLFKAERLLQRISAILNLGVLTLTVYTIYLIKSRGVLDASALLPALYAVMGLGSLCVVVFAVSSYLTKKWSHGRNKTDLDEKTGALNWHCLEELLDQEVRRAGRYRYAMSLCRLDIDDFRSYNKSFGKHKADELLKRFSRVMRGTVRFTDTFARYEADEFCVVLPHTDIVQAEQFVKRALAIVQEQVDCCFSAGITLFKPGESKAQLLMRAKTALDYAKNEGKKKVCCIVGDDNSSAILNF